MKLTDFRQLTGLKENLFSACVAGCRIGHVTRPPTSNTETDWQNFFWPVLETESWMRAPLHNLQQKVENTPDRM